MTDNIAEVVDKLILEANKRKDNYNQIDKSFVHNTLGRFIPENDRSSVVLDRVFSELRERGIELIDDTIDDNGEIVESKRSNNADNIITPFDTSAINIETKNITVYSLMERVKYKEIDLYTDFQRNFGLWDDNKKSRLIESLMLRIPLPAFILMLQMMKNGLLLMAYNDCIASINLWTILTAMNHLPCKD
ncbi:DUF262 domain-containing protein [Bifidobacterium callitrichos]|uniref:DUF262 domain-containing protein n=1 Tax=Bifidobacterium callitrichos TaxID=762209 RepID=UPI0021595202|nr:DUF262 domain-containing protein [Bifidobacterium callitrichos]